MRAPEVRVAARVALAAALVCALAGACMAPPTTQRASVSVTTNGVPTVTAPPAADGSYPRLGGTTVGSLVSVEPFDSVEPALLATGAAAYRIKYLSTSAMGGGIVEVTGSAYVPAGDPPPGGWRVLTYNHGNTGIDANCGPSLYDDLRTEWVPIAPMLEQNYLVVQPDYEGLGGNNGPGVKHSLFNAPGLGMNVIDAVRAARQLVPNVGTRWGTFGGSLGGLATWAANEQAPTYGNGLELVGAASVSPSVGVGDLPAKALAGKLPHDQLYVYFLAILSMKYTLHPELNLTDYVHGALYDNRDLLTLCTGSTMSDAGKFLETASTADLTPISAEAAQRMSSWLNEIDVPKQRTAAPMLVIYGTDDTLVDQSSIDAALAGGCALGDSITWVLRPGENHSNIDAQQVGPWLYGRFDGEAAVNRCA